MTSQRGQSISEADIPVIWDQIATDLELPIESEYAMGSGELLVEFPTGMRVRQGGKMKMADVRNAPTKIKCPALAASGNQDDLYLLAFVNPDVPSMEKPVQRLDFRNYRGKYSGKNIKTFSPSVEGKNPKVMNS